MRYIGVTNPLPLVIGFAPIYFYYRLVTGTPMTTYLLNGELEGGLIFTLVTSVLVIGPLILLMFCKLIAVDDEKITLIYPFRLHIIKFRNDQLKSVYRQLNNSGQRISFHEIHLYFGQEKRMKFNSFEILNFNGLSEKLESVNKNPSC